MTRVRKIGNIILLAVLFAITNIEWNYFEWLVKFMPYDLYVLLFTLAAVSACYLKKEDLKSRANIIMVAVAAVVSLACKLVLHSTLMFILAWVVFFIVFLSTRLRFSIGQCIGISFWLGLFYYYWTFDVKGFFKGYDVYYGSIILFTGFVFTFIVIEYAKYYIKTAYSGTNRLCLFIKSHDYLITLFEVFMVAWADNIMSWYQSKSTFYITLFFVVIMILPKDIKKIKGVYNYFTALSVCGIIAYLVMFVYSRSHLEVFTAPFILALVCLIGIARSFYISKVSEDYSVFDSDRYRLYVRKNWKIKSFTGAVAALTVAVPAAILAPLENYYPNIKDLTFSVMDFYPTFLIGALIFTVFCAITAVILRKPSFKVFCTILFALGFTTYIQVMFLNKKLTESNGARLDIDSLGNYPTVNLIIWIAVFAVVCTISYFMKNWKKMIWYVGGLLCIMQIVAAISLPFSFVSRDRSVSYDLSSSDEFEIAAKDNIIVFVIDTLGSVQYDAALAEFPELNDGLNDFTYYNNADCSYAWTMPSMTHMLTGSDVDFNAEGLYEWQYDSWNSEKVTKAYERIHEAGYKTSAYTGDVTYIFGDGENLVGKYDNVKQYEHIVNREKVLDQMFRFSMLKTLPYSFKGRFLVNVDSFAGAVEAIHDENDDVSNCDIVKFYNRLKGGLTVDENTENAMKVILLNGIHAADLYLDDRLEEQEKNPGASKVVVANMSLVKMYIEEMKRLGKYDDATIIITADHGTHIGIADPQPVLFVKNKGEKSDKMRVSTAPVTHDELLPSIMKAAGADYSDYGYSYSDIGEEEVRERTTIYMSTDQDVYSFYTYTGDREELLKKFPDNPDDVREVLK